eukprot:CAMPEP_0194516434 /NCGR_PEP_ID=MMETSP0253-20130528/49319_1 /TAXON_ID=2966 /ORGANISM="Noctiluca scintillans" /LENGTH=290 /DNA_ID=CAMNT_0039360287 /DNA_START=14 /DNA_END=886 /DNA_ORIENTATION=-
MGDGMEVLRTMEGQLEMISDCMRESPEGDDQKGLVQELLTECEDMQKHMENLAVEVIELPDGADTFNRITVSLDRLARLQAKYPGWCATPAGEMPPASPAPSFDIGAAHAAHEQYERSPSVSANGDHVVERQKKKKSSKEKKRRDPPSEDFGTSFPTGGDAFTQSWPPAEEMDGGWGASGSGGGVASWDAGASHGGAAHDWGASFDDPNAAWGTSAGANPSAGPTSSFGAFGDAGWSSSGGSQFSSMHIARPFNEVVQDPSFHEQFQRSLADSLGVPRHRIRVNGVRPGY